MTTTDRRREIFEAVRSKAHEHGLKFEGDPTYLAAVEDWIAGTIDAEELRTRYLQLLVEREREQRVKNFVKQCLGDPNA